MRYHPSNEGLYLVEIAGRISGGYISNIDCQMLLHIPHESKKDPPNHSSPSYDSFQDCEETTTFVVNSLV